jgi:hypothetical protein
MKWINGLDELEKLRLIREKRLEKIANQEKWHKWFAWYPITIGKTKDRHKIKVWLQHIYRRAAYYHFYTTNQINFENWEYSEEKPKE